MKAKKLIFFFVFFCTLGINAQTPVCTVNTMGWKKIPTIPVDIKCIYTCIQTQEGCRKIYNSSSNFFISFNICIINNKLNCKHKHFYEKYDLTKYNLIIMAYGKGDACDISMDYTLYNDGTERPALLVNVLIPEVRCKAIRSLGQSFLVLKKNCPIRPKVCLLQHLIGLKDND